MSNRLIFDILLFDPRIVPNRDIPLPIDLDDFIHQIKEKWPISEILDRGKDNERHIVFYISTQHNEPWVVANYIADGSQLQVSSWPKSISKPLIYWYRQYIPFNYPLFLVIPSYGYVVELTVDTTLDDIERMYPYSVADD